MTTLDEILKNRANSKNLRVFEDWEMRIWLY